MPTDLFKRGFEPDSDSGTQLSDWKYIVQNWTLTMNDNLANDSETTIYTVPAGKTLYVFMIYIVCQNEGALAGPSIAEIKIKGINVLSLLPGEADNGHEALSFTFPVPIKLVAGELIKIASDRANLEAHGGFVGYLSP